MYKSISGDSCVPATRRPPNGSRAEPITIGCDGTFVCVTHTGKEKGKSDPSSARRMRACVRKRVGACRLNNTRRFRISVKDPDSRAQAAAAAALLSSCVLPPCRAALGSAGEWQEKNKER